MSGLVFPLYQEQLPRRWRLMETDNHVNKARTPPPRPSRPSVLPPWIAVGHVPLGFRKRRQSCLY